MNNREIIARRVAKEFNDGDIVNLGIGMPTLAANYVPENIHIMLEAENGILGVGPAATEETASSDCIDAGSNRVTTVQGACFIDSAASFGLIRGGHVDATVLGALEVDEKGNLANWMIPGKKVTGMGGAMDLVCGAKKVIIAMEHVNKNGSPKIVKACTMPLTAKGEVDLIITNLAVIRVVPDVGLVLEEIFPDYTVDKLRGLTGADFTVSPDLKPLDIS